MTRHGKKYAITLGRYVSSEYKPGVCKLYQRKVDIFKFMLIMVIIPCTHFNAHIHLFERSVTNPLLKLVTYEIHTVYKVIVNSQHNATPLLETNMFWPIYIYFVSFSGLYMLFSDFVFEYLQINSLNENEIHLKKIISYVNNLDRPCFYSRKNALFLV